MLMVSSIIKMLIRKLLKQTGLCCYNYESYAIYSFYTNGRFTMKKSILILMLTGTSLVSPQIQTCNLTNESPDICPIFFEVTAESIKAVSCRNSGIIKVTLSFPNGFEVGVDLPIRITLTRPNGFPSSSDEIIPNGSYNPNASISFEIPVPAPGLYTVTTNITGFGCVFTCTNVRVKQVNCLPFLYCCVN